jgi:hypothetical protein
MKQQKLLCALVTSILLWGFTCPAPSAAQEKGMWRAASKTARSITGDVAFADIKVAINFSSFTIANIRNLTPAELTATFDAGPAAAGIGTLYRLDIPGTKKFLHSNTLCGAEDTQWIATYVSGRDLQLAFFSGSNMPVFTPEVLSNSTDLCGLYSYVR